MSEADDGLSSPAGAVNKWVLKMFRVSSEHEINVGLCRGRHSLFTNDGVAMDAFIFKGPKHGFPVVSSGVAHRHEALVEQPTATDILERVCRGFIRDYMEDFKGILAHRRFNLYVTGLSPALTSFLKLWTQRQEELEMGYADLVLWHWDTETEQYVPQKWAVLT